MEIFYHPQFIRLEYSFLLQILTSQDFVTQTLVRASCPSAASWCYIRGEKQDSGTANLLYLHTLFEFLNSALGFEWEKT